jgi:hypothetical protein
MPTGAQITWHYSVNTGPGLSTAQGDPNDSIGGFASSTTWDDTEALFDTVSGDENAASDVEYRCVFIRNPISGETAFGGKVWITEDAGGPTHAIALAGQGVVADNSASVQADRLADEGTAPSGETFTSPATKAAGLSTGDIGANQVIGVFVRRTTANTAQDPSESFTLHFGFDNG